MVERLRQAATEGRLLTHELEQRLTAAFSARTYGELDRLVADLPRGQVERRPQGTLAHWVRPALALIIAVPLAVALVATVVAVVTGLFFVWATFAAIAWCVFGRRRFARRHYGYLRYAYRGIQHRGFRV